MRKKGFRWGALAVFVLAAAAALVWYRQVQVTAYSVERGGAEPSIVSEWNRYISEYINHAGISMIFDGKKVDSVSGDLYIDQNGMLMISEHIVRDVFGCSIFLTFHDSIDIEDGDTSVNLWLNQKYGFFNKTEFVDQDYQFNLTSAPELLNGEVFVPAEALERGLKYSVRVNMEDRTVTVASGNASKPSLPFAYDCRRKGRTADIKDQGAFGTCWAFAALTALEMSVRPRETLRFSADHMSLSTAFNREGIWGGDYAMAAAYLTSWDGPVYERDDPYGDGRREELPAVKHVQEVQFPQAKDYAMIKKMVFQYGGVQTSIYLSIDPESMTSYYYNRDTYAYCYAGANKANHDVVIIGWDDNYPAENFSIDVDQDGAFICQNSWGHTFGDNGVFYVSYYDTNIGLYNAVYTKVEDADNYDAIYQTDLSGWTGNLGYGKEDAYFGNVYTAEEHCTLEAVGFYATQPYTTYSVYTSFQTEASGFVARRENGSGTFTNAGYYTVKLDRPVELEKGESFTVIVYIKTPNSRMPVAVEYKAEGDDTTDLSDGEGYISANGISWERTEEAQNANICLKAYTKNIGGSQKQKGDSK